VLLSFVLLSHLSHSKKPNLALSLSPVLHAAMRTSIGRPLASLLITILLVISQVRACARARACACV
jgi:hypothetical protein